MMRVYLVVFILMIIVFGGAIAGYFTISSTTDSMINILEQLKEEVEAGNWDQARQTQKQVLNEWDRANTIFSYLVDHEQLHDLDIKLHRLSGQLKFEQKSRILPEIEISLDLVKNIMDEQKPLLKNIF